MHHKLEYANTVGEILLMQVITIVASRWSYVVLFILLMIGVPGSVARLAPEVGVPAAVLFATLTHLFALAVSILGAGLFLIGYSFVTVRGKAGQLHSVIIDPDSITERTETDVTVSKWAGIHRIRRVGNTILIYVGPTSAHILPRRSYGGDWEQLHRDILQAYEGARV